LITNALYQHHAITAGGWWAEYARLPTMAGELADTPHETLARSLEGALV